MKKLELCNLGVEQLDTMSMAQIEGGLLGININENFTLIDFKLVIPTLTGQALTIRLFVPIVFGISLSPLFP
ncbi:hypothetical protein [Pedobacter sp. NJ-S-72]